MAELSLQWGGTYFVPVTESDREFCRALRVGAVMRGEFKQMQRRNYEFHKRYFALLGLGFDYWEPSGGLISESERKLLQQFVVMLENTFDRKMETMHELREQFVDRIALRRAESFPAVEKSFEAFRKWAIVEAGFYDTEITPTGPRRVARSISFAKMQEHEFKELYKATFNVLWRVVLSQKFDTEADAMAAAEQLGALA